MLHWYDFLCPFCYIAQARTAILVRHGLEVIELPFQAHPDIPAEGLLAGPRLGPMYANLAREARNAGLPLNWNPYLPNTRLALAAAEWVRRYQPEAFAEFHRSLFEAHFVLGEDLGNLAVIDRHARDWKIDLVGLHVALDDGSAVAAVATSEALGCNYGVRGTPAWLLAKQLISGLLPASEFIRLAEYAQELPR
jgi:predicted DsbA family dithiol-disulfide isomerase